MEREKNHKDQKSADLFEQLKGLYNQLDDIFISQLNRSLPFNETILDRWERAKRLNFGENSSIYNSSLVFGNIKVGSDVWIGPNTILDGSGGLEIGNYCTISAGVHIYTHDNVKQTLSSGKQQLDRLHVKIGNNVYIAPNSIITKNVEIGNMCVIAAFSFVNKSFPNNSIIMGQPAKKVGHIEDTENGLIFKYYEK
jgi:acetyltransferase-like isoleucine patch superfamily enzyme